jgi:hypothetical protein
MLCTYSSAGLEIDFMLVEVKDTETLIWIAANIHPNLEYNTVRDKLN